MIEVELKYHVADEQRLRARLTKMGASLESVQRHVDTYFNHPCRDFAQTHEALRVRKIDGKPYVTYKGAKLPGTVKARRELEWALHVGDPDGAKMRELLLLLGFREVATVVKHRENYAISDAAGSLSITIDAVEGLGTFAEVEAIAKEHVQVESTRGRVSAIGQMLDLGESEPSSYLRLLLAKRDRTLCDGPAT